MRARLAFGVVAALAAGMWLVGQGAAVAAENKDAVAVIIGNKAYENRDVPEVSFAHNDADAVRRYVTDILGFRERNIIDLRDATQAEIEGAFGNERSHKGDLWRLVREGRSDVVVYYSGHGMPGLSDGQGYLLPSNAAPARVEINGYPLEVLYANLAKLNARSVLVLLDACFSGTSHAGPLVPAGSGITVAPKGAAPPRGITVLTAAGADQIASWDLEAGHGLFTEHLLRGVYGTADSPEFAGDGDGRVTAAELKHYLDEEMTYAARRAFGREQDASFEGDGARVLSAFPPDRPPMRPRVTAVSAAVAPPEPEAPAVETAQSASMSFEEADALVRREAETSGRTASDSDTAGLVLPNGTPAQRYDFARALFRLGDYKEAERAFRAFLTAHPEDTRASNAQYWLGEIDYVRADYEAAARAFLKG